MNKYLSIKEAADLLGVSTSTMRRWENEGRLIPDERTEGNQRRYKLSSIRPEFVRADNSKKKTIAYARVSSRDQKEDLERQKKVLEMFCSANGWCYELIADLGSGMNYYKKGLKYLLNQILEDGVDRLIITHKDRLLRFGAELVFAICAAKKVEVVILNQGDESSFEEDLAEDVLEIITVFSARLYGSRSHKNKKMIANLREAVVNANGPQN